MSYVSPKTIPIKKIIHNFNTDSFSLAIEWMIKPNVQIITFNFLKKFGP